MKSRKKINFKKILVVILFAGLILRIGGFAFAQQDNSFDQALISTGNTGNVAIPQSGSANPNKIEAGTTNGDLLKQIGPLAFGIVYVGSRIMVWASWGVDFALALGKDVMSLEAVKTGWTVVLNLTNLGFVLAIIVIAFATIFRRESYGLKKTLPKLIIAALLVNFSLVICGGIITASNDITDVFKTAALGSNGANLSVALGNAFQPQKLGDTSGTPPGLTASLYGLVTGDIRPVLQYLASIVFVIIFTFLMVMAFLALFLMLLMRVIYLVILLILSPIVWLCWVFPATSKYWKDWWHQFIRWNLFAPAVLFFIYLAIATATTIQTVQPTSIQQVQSMPNSPGVALDQALIGASGGWARYSANLFIILGLLFAGIFVANKLGLAGGSVGINVASRVGKGVGRWAGTKARTWSTAPLRSDKMKEFTANMQKFGASRGLLARAVTFPVRKVGDYTSRIRETQQPLLKKADERIGKLPSPTQKALRWGTEDIFGKIAILQDLRKSGDLNELTGAGVSLENINSVLTQMDKYNQRSKDITEVSPLLDKDIYTPMQKGDFGTFGKKLTEYMKGLSPSKASKVQLADIVQGKFKGTTTQTDWNANGVPEVAKAIINGLPAEGVSQVYRSLKENDRDRLHIEVVKALDSMFTSAHIQFTPNHAGRMTALETVKPKLHKFFNGMAATDMGITLD